MDCAKDFSRVCEARFCSDPLPPNAFYPADLRLSNTVIGRNPQSLRIAVVDATSPAGGAVQCAQITSISQLSDATSFNLTTSIVDAAMTGSGDSFETQVSLNGSGRVVYVEVYAVPKNGLNEPGVTPIGVGCAAMPSTPLVPCTASNMATCSRVTLDVASPKN